MVRRKTTDDDIDRLVENLLLQEGDFIQDRDSFDLSLKRYIPEENFSDRSKDKIFNEIINQKPSVLRERLFKKAKGKDLQRDRRQTAKIVVKTREEFIKRGSKRVDFAGFDIKESEIRRQAIISRKGFDVASVITIKKTGIRKVVFSKRESVIIKGKSFVRHREKLGRFVSAKRKDL